MRRLLLLLLLTLDVSARGQTPSPSASATPATVSRTPIWRCDLPGGTYEVALRAIVSVSMHEYVVDGVARVNELNIDTDGNMAVRFYYLEPIAAKSPTGIGQSAIDRASDLAKEIGQRAGADQIWERVVKNYPTTTHAHTIEYRVESDDQLKQVFNSVQQAFESGRSGSYQPPS
ncbi:MAG: hypothetical protein H0X40_13945 [Chthoniobacterales bacterium]|nr:hypothetical protein [Chthoniobacterales bacterium]